METSKNQELEVPAEPFVAAGMFGIPRITGTDLAQDGHGRLVKRFHRVMILADQLLHNGN
jgi:hypothetical protein